MKLLGKSSLSSKLGGLLTLLWGLMLITIFITGCYSIISITQPKILVLRDYPRAFRMELSSTENKEIFEIQETASWIKEPQLKVSTTLDFKAGNRWIVLYYFFGGFVIFGLSLISLFQLREFFKSLSSGHPFIEKNADRLRLIGWITIGQAVFEMLYQAILAVLIQNAVVIKGMVVRLGWESILGELLGVRGYQVFTGFVILVIAAVFRIGSQLREEQALTI